MRDPCRLYLITPPEIELESFAPKLEAALDAGDVACLQLRLKGANDDDVRRAGERLLPICQSRSVPLLINDRPDLAAEIGADGAHVGADDASYTEARERSRRERDGRRELLRFAPPRHGGGSLGRGLRRVRRLLPD